MRERASERGREERERERVHMWNFTFTSCIRMRETGKLIDLVYAFEILFYILHAPELVIQIKSYPEFN